MKQPDYIKLVFNLNTSAINQRLSEQAFKHY